MKIEIENTKNLINRRQFIVELKAGLTMMSAFTMTAFLQNGCSYIESFHIGGELEKVVRGAPVYNGKNPNLKFIEGHHETFLDNIIDHKPAWSGTQYELPHGYHICASAPGKAFLQQINGYHGWEDYVYIDHGNITTYYYHMSLNTSKIQFGQDVQRGDIVGKAGIAKGRVKTHLKRRRVRDDLDNYGEDMGYMKRWVGKQRKEPSIEEVVRKEEVQRSLIGELRESYIGPGANQMKDVWGYTEIPKSLNHPASKQSPINSWSHSMLFKLLKHIYDNNPMYFSNSKFQTKELIDDIYRNQPVVLTLPFPT